ncbi:MAG: hypothetical protein KC478_10825 [Bacteriovoracaceae bacterium]|nr:hypothetical protein [Bacteriovoracaceae bacterium]
MMNMTTIYKSVILVFLITLVSCSSGKIVPTKDVCTVERHFKDYIYQVKINGEAISTQWYIKEDAIEIVRDLAKKNLCMAWK